MRNKERRAGERQRVCIYWYICLQQPRLGQGQRQELEITQFSHVSADIQLLMRTNPPSVCMGRKPELGSECGTHTQEFGCGTQASQPAG